MPQGRRGTPSVTVRSDGSPGPSGTSHPSDKGKSTIRVSVLYPKGEGSTFNMDYYKTKHRQICVDVMPGLKKMVVEAGIDGPYEAVGHLYFDDMGTMGAAMGGPRIVEAQNDLVNYTNIVPVIQISQHID